MPTSGSSMYGTKWSKKSARGQKSASKMTMNSPQDRRKAWRKLPAFFRWPRSGRTLYSKPKRAAASRTSGRSPSSRTQTMSRPSHARAETCRYVFSNTAIGSPHVGRNTSTEGRLAGVHPRTSAACEARVTRRALRPEKAESATHATLMPNTASIGQSQALPVTENRKRLAPARRSEQVMRTCTQRICGPRYP